MQLWLAAESQKFQELGSNPTQRITCPWHGLPPTRLQAINHRANVKLSLRHWESSPSTSSSPCSLPTSPHTSFPSQVLLGSFTAWFCSVPTTHQCLPCQAGHHISGLYCPRLPGSAGGTEKPEGGFVADPCQRVSFQPPSYLLLQTILREPHTSSLLPAASHSPVSIYYYNIQPDLEPSLLNHSVCPSCSMAWAKPTHAHPFHYSF